MYLRGDDRNRRFKLPGEHLICLILLCDIYFIIKIKPYWFFLFFMLLAFYYRCTYVACYDLFPNLHRACLYVIVGGGVGGRRLVILP